MDIDPFPLLYYGLICAALAGLTPPLFGMQVRIVFGAIVGVAAAMGIDEVRAMVGF